MKLVINMVNKVINILKNNYTIPSVLLTNYKDLKINEKDLIVLIYIMNQKNNLFDPGSISSDLKISLPDVLEVIEKLNENNLVEINTCKNNGVLEEIINLDCLYRKLAYLIVNKEENVERESNIYDLFEKEFARPISAIETELISSWLDNEYSEELIECALKEAVYNGVSNLRYIDKILYEWNKKGIKNKEDVEKDKQNFKKNKSNKKIEWVDYDYLNEDE